MAKWGATKAIVLNLLLAIGLYHQRQARAANGDDNFSHVVTTQTVTLEYEPPSYRQGLQKRTIEVPANTPLNVERASTTGPEGSRRWLPLDSLTDDLAPGNQVIFYVCLPAEKVGAPASGVATILVTPGVEISPDPDWAKRPFGSNDFGGVGCI